ncbi:MULTISPECIES: acyltransferase [Chryseobacterium]|uniref:Inner membrane protein YiaH n=1 Tax=Chryseobacterium taihuense TaxID=1141221 RepID=A0A4U8WGR2_9FLAO|nr:MULTISPECIES: acyltransferase family protein [Chryseobacterium]QQV02147.1 acyltransferase family protein [Chryseobacterium sp. FDAARGOS 1104]VFB04620.1 Inner membrane protein YiaH [Chryseobacterium taihuense]
MEKDSIQWIHILRATATFAVIVLHCTIPYGNNYDPQNINWLIATFVNSNVRFCVPIFLMLSGVLLLGKNYSLSDFLKKRISRILLPFLFWSIIYFFMTSPVRSNITQLSFDFFKAMKSGTCYHLWYIYMIIGVYLFLPIINKWISNASKKEILFYLILWLLVLLIDLPVINRLYTVIDLRYFSGFLGYVIFGFYLYRYSKAKTNTWIFIILFIAGNFLTFSLIYIFSKADGAVNKTFYSYLTPNIILSSYSIFMLFKNKKIKESWLTKIMEIISKYSYGIYLCHVFSMMILPKMGIVMKTSYAFVNILGTAFLSLALSLAVVLVLNKLPLGKYISG